MVKLTRTTPKATSGERDRVLGGEKHDGYEVAIVAVDHLCFAKTDSDI
jgi:hypothetical protein